MFHSLDVLLFRAIMCISGRKEIISEFKALVASLPKDMEAMQSQLSNYKGASSGLHSLRAEVQSLSTILHRKVRNFPVSTYGNGTVLHRHFCILF